MDFEFTGLEIGLNMNKDVLIDILNEDFKGWILIDNEKDGDYFIMNVSEYANVRDLMRCTYSHISSNIIKNELYDIKVREGSGSNLSCPLKDDDKIHKLKLVDEITKEPVIKWWKKGKFESIKTFEQFNDIDPYGEEDWEEGDKIYDLSDEDIDTQIETLKRLILAQEYEIHFFYTEMIIDNDKKDKDGPGDVVKNINNIISDDDGSIIFEGTIMSYENENWFEDSVYFILDTTHPIKFTNSDIEIRL